MPCQVMCRDVYGQPATFPEKLTTPLRRIWRIWRHRGLLREFAQ
jgi:hypothetical protein